jgi:hypothetical protein
MISHAITGDAPVFIACLPSNSVSRDKSYKNEELTLAVEQMRLRPPDDSWLIPVRGMQIAVLCRCALTVNPRLGWPVHTQARPHHSGHEEAWHAGAI